MSTGNSTPDQAPPLADEAAPAVTAAPAEAAPEEAAPAADAAEAVVADAPAAAQVPAADESPAADEAPAVETAAPPAEPAPAHSDEPQGVAAADEEAPASSPAAAPVETDTAAAEPDATVESEQPAAAADEPATAAEPASPPAAALPAAGNSPNRTSMSPKAEAKRPAPLPTSPGPQQNALSQPQQPIVSTSPNPQPQSPPPPAAAPRPSGPPPIIQHVRANFGDVLGPPMEAEVYRRGWVEASVEELHDQLRQHAQAIFVSLSHRLSSEELTDAVFGMLGGILRFHHGEQTQNLLFMLQRAYPIDHLFAAMLNPVFLKSLVEALLASRLPPAQRGAGGGGGDGARQQQSVPRSVGGNPSVVTHPVPDVAAGRGVGVSVGGAAPLQGAQFNRNGPQPAASPVGTSPAGAGGAFPVHGDGSQRGSPAPQGAGRGASGKGSNAASPTAPNPPVPRSQQIRQQQQNQHPQQQQQTQLPQHMQPQQPNVVHRGPDGDMTRQRQALSQAQAALQRTMGGQAPLAGTHGGRPTSLEHDAMGSGSFPAAGEMYTPNSQMGGHSASGNSMFGGAQSGGGQAQPPTPSSTTSNVPFSPLAAAFSAARQPKPAEPAPVAAAKAPAGKQPMARGGGVQPQPARPGQPGQQQQPPSGGGPNIAEGLQSMLNSGARGGRIRMDGGGMSWADTEESVASSGPAAGASPDPDLANFLHHHNLAVLIEPLAPKTTLHQLRAMGGQEFELTLKRWVASTGRRMDLKRALHPDGRMPPERQAWLRQQQQQQLGAAAPGAPQAGPSAGPGGAAAAAVTTSAAAAPTGPGGLPAPRSKNPPTAGSAPVGPAPTAAAAAAAAASSNGGAPQQYGAGANQLMFLRLKLRPHDPDGPQPTDSCFARDAQRQIMQMGVTKAKYLATTWANQGGGGRGGQGGGDPVPTVTFTLPKAAAESLRQMEQAGMSVANVSYTIEKCTVSPSLPRNVRLPDGHPLHSMATPAAPAHAPAGLEFGKASPAAVGSAAGPTSYSAVSALGLGSRPPAAAVAGKVGGAAMPAPKSPKQRPAQAPPSTSSTPQQKPAPARHADPVKATPDHAPARAPAHATAASLQRHSKRAHDDDERAQVCRFYGAPSGCRRGAECQFRHTEGIAAANAAAAANGHFPLPLRGGRGGGGASRYTGRDDYADHASPARGGGAGGGSRGRGAPAAGKHEDADPSPARSAPRRRGAGHA